MSAYNGSKYIKEQVLSIINQKTQNDVTIRIRDDGSVDETTEIIMQLRNEYPNKIELIRGNNIGYNASFFYLLNNAKGYDYYAISDQDDVWLDNKLETAVKALEKEKEDIPLLFASTSFLVEDDMQPYGTTRKKQRPFTIYNTIIQNICPGHTQVFNNKLLELVNRKIDVENIYVYDSWITNLAMLYGKIVFDNDSYTYYRQHRQNQLGYGKGRIGQLLTSAKHTKKGDGSKYRRQIKYFVCLNKEELMKQGYYKELYRFADSKGFISRLKVVLRNKIYRQKRMETIAFYCAYMIGKF